LDHEILLDADRRQLESENLPDLSAVGGPLLAYVETFAGTWRWLERLRRKGDDCGLAARRGARPRKSRIEVRGKK
jgi:hypothetical protein